MEDLPVVVAATVRTGEPRDPARRVLETLIAEPGIEVLRPSALSSGATGQLVRSGLGDQADDALCAVCHEMTGGNPFLVRELVREIAAAQLGTGTELSERVRGISPRTVSRSVLVRLARLSPAALALARAVAVLGARAELRLSAGLADLGIDEGGRAAQALLAAEVLRDIGGTLEFVHPLVREAVYGDLSSPARGRLHAQAAAALAVEQRPAAELANHLLLATATGSEWVVETLRAAAADARRRGAPESAARYLDRALAEPPPVASRADVLWDLGVSESTLDPAAAGGHLMQARELVEDQPRRAQVSLALAHALAITGHFVDAAHFLTPELAHLGSQHPELTASLEATQMAIARWDLGAQDIRRDLLAKLRRRATNGPELDPRLHANLAIELAAAGVTRELAVHHARLAFLDEERFADAVANALPEAISVLIFADLVDDAERAAEAALKAAAARGSSITAAVAASTASIAALFRGEVSLAVAYAREAAAPTAGLWISPIGIAFLIAGLTARGDLSAAHAALAEHRLDGELGADWPSTVLRYMRARLAAAGGDHTFALSELLACGELTEAWGVRNPAMMAWRSSAAHSLAALEHYDEAQWHANAEVALASEWGAGSSIGVALRAAAASDPGPDGKQQIRQAVELLERSPARLELSFAVTELGVRLRHEGRRTEARESLRRGLDLAHHCGATALADRARQELVLAGAKPRRDALRGRDALTAAELRVAMLATDGQTNRRIAQSLFVTTRTVEHHLSSAYTKLGIRSRADLAGALARQIGVPNQTGVTD